MSLALRNIKNFLQKKEEFKHKYKATGMTLTIQTMPVDGYLAIEDVMNVNPLEPTKTPIELEKEVEAIYIAYGVKEFDGDLELAKEYLQKESLGQDNFELLYAIRSINLPATDRINEIIITIAFHQEEARLLEMIVRNDSTKELVKYLSDSDNVIEAMAFCKDFIVALEYIQMFVREKGVPLPQAALMVARQILVAKGYKMEELFPDQIPKTPPPPSFGEDNDVPTIGINIEAIG
jgi:hypothetical protein